MQLITNVNKKASDSYCLFSLGRLLSLIYNRLFKQLEKASNNLHNYYGLHKIGHVHRLPRAADYGPNESDTVQFIPAANGWRTKNHIPDMPPPLIAEGKEPPT
jgi:hypothetical protein